MLRISKVIKHCPLIKLARALVREQYLANPWDIFSIGTHDAQTANHPQHDLPLILPSNQCQESWHKGVMKLLKGQLRESTARISTHSCACLRILVHPCASKSILAHPCTFTQLPLCALCQGTHDGYHFSRDLQRADQQNIHHTEDSVLIARYLRSVSISE
jgi:hypothetical protein